ncbi:MAG: sugar ABC transporter permease [Armatimonadetes bacterium]|nr:sugar ABC transporter permease [Armatimonadota bacterium]
MASTKLPTSTPAPPGRHDWGAVWFLLPNALGFLTFTLLPVLAAFLLSFTRWDAVESWQGIHWAGLDNYRDILGFMRGPEGLQASDEQFWQYMYNTVFLMLGIPLGMALSFFTALLMNQRLRGITLYRVIYFLPTVCSAVAVAMVWRWVYDADWGLLNQGLRVAGVDSPPGWLIDPSWAKPALILMGLWMGIGGYNCVLYLAGLQNIPPEFYEAADMDGADWWHKVRHITWPMLAPTTFFIFVMSIIAGFQGYFVSIHILTRGGPAGSTTNLLYYIYQSAFDHQKMGYACALAMILFAIIFVCTLLNWKYGKEGTEMSL